MDHVDVLSVRDFCQPVLKPQCRCLLSRVIFLSHRNFLAAQ